MKCKDCSKTDCPYRTQKSVECGWECVLLENRDKSHVIQIPDEWQSVRIQAAIAAMQGVMNFFGSIDYNRETIAELAVAQADALIAELKKKRL